MGEEKFKTRKLENGFAVSDGGVEVRVWGIKVFRGKQRCWIDARDGEHYFKDTCYISDGLERERIGTAARAEGIVVRDAVLKALLQAIEGAPSEKGGNRRASSSGGSAATGGSSAAAAPVRALADGVTEVRRPLIRGPKGSTFLLTWLPVSVTDPATGVTIIQTERLVISRDRVGAVAVHGPGADLIGTPSPLPRGVIVPPSDPPAASLAGMLLDAATAKRLVAGEMPDLPHLYGKLCACFRQFVAFPEVGAATAADHETFFSCYTISTYFIDAFAAVGYLFLKGLRNSGKSTVAAIVGHTAYLTLFTSANVTVPSLRSHAAAGGVAILDNMLFSRAVQKSENMQLQISFAEFGYQRDARVPVQVPKPRGGWEMINVPVFANRVYTSTDDSPDTLGSRCIETLMLRTDDREKADRAPMDIDEWPHPPQEIVQHCWMAGLHCLQDAARTVRTVTSAATGLSNRDLQVWRPVLTTARLIDRANGDTAVWDAILRVARAQLDRRAEDDGSREAFVVRALLALRGAGKEQATASQVMEIANRLAEQQDADVWGLDSARRVGKLLSRLGVRKTPRSVARGYQLDETTMTRLRATFLPPLPSRKNDANVANVGNVETLFDVSDVSVVHDVFSVRKEAEKTAAEETAVAEKGDGEATASCPVEDASRPEGTRSLDLRGTRRACAPTTEEGLFLIRWAETLTRDDWGKDWDLSEDIARRARAQGIAVDLQSERRTAEAILAHQW
jgi:hypothetical protein